MKVSIEKVGAKLNTNNPFKKMAFIWSSISHLIGFCMIFAISQKWAILSGYNPSFPWPFFSNDYIMTTKGALFLNQITWSRQAITIGNLADGLKYAPLYPSIFMVSRVFENYSKDKIFTKENSDIFVFIGRLCLCNAYISLPLGQYLVTKAVQCADPKITAILSFSSISFSMLILTIIGVSLLFHSTVMNYGLSLKENNDLTV